MATYTRFIALGDSFTEGMQDEKVNEQYRGWADRVAEALATQVPNFTYLNLAVRGKLVGQVIDDQIPAALPGLKAPALSSHSTLVPMIYFDLATTQTSCYLAIKRQSKRSPRRDVS